METQLNLDKAEHAKEVIENLLRLMGIDLSIDKISVGNNIEISLSGNDAGWLIGKKGVTLEAFQFIVNKIVNRFPEDRCYIILDIAGYRERQKNALIKMAESLAEKAKKTGKVQIMEPMPSYKRRIVHNALSKINGIYTESEGDGDEKQIKIIPKTTQKKDKNSE